MYQVSLMYANFRLSTQNNLKSCFKQLKTPSKRLHVQVLSSSLQMFFARIAPYGGEANF